MGNVTWDKKRKLLVIAAIVCVCALAAVAVPCAYGFYYVHSDEGTKASGQGACEVTCVLDETARGGSVRSELVFVPAGSTVKELLNEDIVSSNSQNGLSAIHNYDSTSLKDYLSDKHYECTVYAADSQKPGTHTTCDGEGKTGDSTQLSRYDHVVIKVS
jgi:hypothetical protein